MYTLTEIRALGTIIKNETRRWFNTGARIDEIIQAIIDHINGIENEGLLIHNDLTDKNAETEFQHVDTTTTKETLVNDDKVTIYDSVTGKIVLTGKSNVGIDTFSDVTHEELLVLINNNELTPGSSYRITDYTTTTAQVDTASAGHDFDIIVTALSTNELSENAKCIRKAGDTYFENANLEAWEIKYCIDNDTSRFAWADTVSGKGVIYYMKDEWGNECPYDFKNIQFYKSGVFLYTFGGGVTDNSLIGNSVGNSIKESISSNKLSLNFNTFGTNCKLNTLGFNSNNNTFGDCCFSNTFGNSCNSNTFGDGCQSNTFGTYCSYNAFGSTCNSNTFGNYCGINTFGYNCGSNTFKNGCGSNTFGNDCYSNTFGTGCSNNTFGTGCYYNTFGKDCISNNFYTGTSGATKKNYIRYLVLEDGCANNNFYSTLTTNNTSYLQRIRIKGLEYTTPTNVQITLSETNTKYEWLICRMSDGTLKQYCPNEDINKLLPLIYAGL